MGYSCVSCPGQPSAAKSQITPKATEEDEDELEEEREDEEELDDVEEDKIINHMFIENGQELIKQVAVLAKCNSYLDDHVPGIFIPPPELG